MGNHKVKNVTEPHGIGRVFDCDWAGGVYVTFPARILNSKHSFRASLRLDRVGMFRVSISVYIIVRVP